MTKIREGYKETEIGVIPEDWECSKLSTVSTLIDGDRGKNYPSPNELVDEGILFLSTSNIKDNKFDTTTTKFITKEKFNSLGKGKLEQKDLIITLRGTLGSVMLFESDEFDTAFINAQMMIIRSNCRIDYKYLYHCMISNYIKDQINTNSTGSAQPQLTKKVVSELHVAVPCLEEQQRISEILSTTDNHIEKLDKIIEDYQLLKKGMMKKLLTEGIGHTEFKETEIGRIPKEWEVKKIGELSKVVTGKTPPTKQTELYGEMYPWVTPTDIGKSREIAITERMLSHEGYNSTPVKLPPYTLLVTCIASIGKNSILVKEGSCNQQINAILPNPKVYNTGFLYYWVQHNQKYLEGFSGKTAIPILNKSTFESIKIALPRIEEQDRIASVIEPIDNHIDKLVSQRMEYLSLKKALMEKLLTGKIRVNASRMGA